MQGLIRVRTSNDHLNKPRRGWLYVKYHRDVQLDPVFIFEKGGVAQSLGKLKDLPELADITVEPREWQRLVREHGPRIESPESKP